MITELNKTLFIEFGTKKHLFCVYVIVKGELFNQHLNNIESAPFPSIDILIVCCVSFHPELKFTFTEWTYFSLDKVGGEEGVEERSGRIEWDVKYIPIRNTVLQV